MLTAVPKVGILNTSIATENTGDKIIMDSSFNELRSVLLNYQTIEFPTHEKLSNVSYKLQKIIKFNIACGTNLLHSHMGIVKQWNIGLLDAYKIKPVVLLGVGWRSQEKRKTDIYTKFLLGKVLSKTHYHSVRDSYTESKLRDAGISNVLNTGCPTIWRLDKEHCKEIPVSRGANAVVVLTDYSANRELDTKLMDYVLTFYKKVYFWCQGTKDLEYLNTLGFRDNVQLLPPSLNGYNALLSDPSIALDYVGTRLHGGIRALQYKRRSTIIGVDHRANKKGSDFNLPVISRYASEVDIKEMISGDRDTKVLLPVENIEKWKSQFSDAS